VDPWFWIWLVAAVVLSVAEIFTAGLFMLPFGIGAAIAAILAYLEIDLLWQWAAFLGVSVVLLFVLRRFAERITHEPPQKVAGDRLIGKTGTVLESIDGRAGHGMVRVEREQWRAEAPGSPPIARGSAVRVVSVVGTHLVVEPCEHPCPEGE